MSKSNNRAPLEKFQFPDSRKLWHDGVTQTRSLGCEGCAYLARCGGLQVEAGVFDCLTFCRCTDPAICDNVCPRNLMHFVARSQEVGGFDLDRVPRAPLIEPPALPLIVPMIYHSSARSRAPRAPMVALSLYELFSKKDGSPRFATRKATLDHFRLGEDTAIILSGTDDDPAIERWWRLPEREAVARHLSALGLRLITTPNFSLFDDVPRHDNLFNMKRIALVWSEIQREGLSCALHLNARTDRDWEHWSEFLNARPEIRAVAFEFGTGAGARLRIQWHVTQLKKLAANVNQPLHLIVRGGLTELAGLNAAFSGLTVIDTSAFIRAQKRKRAVLRDGRLRWESAPTLVGAPIDDLLDENIEAVCSFAALAVNTTTEQPPVSAGVMSA